MFYLILFLAFESNIMKSCFAGRSGQFPGSPWEVSIFNYMKDAELVIHCKSKDDDLGEKHIAVGNHYYWMFKENFWQTTLFWCNFWSKYGHASGEVFWPEKGSYITDRCSKNTCNWAAVEQGIYLANTPLKQLEFMYPWQR